MNDTMHPPTPADTALAPRPLSRIEIQRALGATIGSAVADALGAPFEFGPAGAYSQRFATPVHGGIGEMVGGGGFGWAPGEFTDDTQMAMVIARSLIDTGHYDPDALWAGWLAWASTAADVGITTRASLHFEDWREVTVDDPERTAGNGALMRATPLALAWLGADDAAVRSIVLHQAALTHQHPAAGWGAWFAVAMMRAAIAGRDMFAALDAELAAAPAEITERFAPILSADWTPEQPAPANGTVWGCLAQAVWAVRHHARFDDAVVAAIDLGGDTDTVAAVAGALAGARAGVQQIPSRWVTYLHGSVTTAEGREHFTQADLQQLTLNLIGVQVCDEGPADAPLGPTEVAPGLYAANLSGAQSVPEDWAVVSLCRTGSMFAETKRRSDFIAPSAHS